VSSSVSLRDIAATILDLTGVPSDRLPGASLAPYWGGATVEGAQPRISEVVRPDGKAMTSVEVAGRHLIRNPDGSEELFRLPEDLTESTNLLPADSGAPWLPSLRTILDSLPPQPDFKP
jgi:hypothetical protein